MALSIAKLVESKRKKWQSKLQHTKRQVLHKCLSNFNRVLGYRKKQESNGKNPICNETTVVENPSCSKTTTTVELPDDIVEEILQRLRVKDLMRWKSVSKGWKSLIESSHLAEKHLCTNHKKYGAEAMKISFESSSRGFRINYFTKQGRLIIGNYHKESETVPRVLAGSYNGLVCTYDLVYVYLLNPITGVTRKLSPPLGTKHTVGFGRDYVVSIGFGRDIVSGRYKVVVLYSFDDDKILKIKVFDLSTNKWRGGYKTVGPEFLSLTDMTLLSSGRNPVFVNGSLFWLLNSEILIMDLHTEEFHKLSIPNSTDDVSSEVFLLWRLEERLYATEYRECVRLNLWVLVQDEVGERWDKTIYASMEHVFTPVLLNEAWFSPSLISPYQ